MVDTTQGMNCPVVSTNVKVDDSVGALCTSACVAGVVRAPLFDKHTIHDGKPSGYKVDVKSIQPPGFGTNPSMQVEFTLRWDSFTWQTANGVQNTISADKPQIVSGFSVSVNEGVSHVYCPYVEGGTRVKYDIKALPLGVAYDRKSQSNPYLQRKTPVIRSAIKIAFHTKRPDTPVTTIPLTKDAPVAPPTLRKNDLSVFLAGGWIGMDELALCMQGNKAGTVLPKEFSHNFTPMSLHVHISDAVVTIDGVRHTDGPSLRVALGELLATQRLVPSMMPSMHNRAQVNAQPMSCEDIATARNLQSPARKQPG